MQNLNGKFAAVLPAGGLGKRMGGNIPKQLMLLGGKLGELIACKMKIVVGGAERWQSVENGVNALTSNAEFVLVHDVARPLGPRNDNPY
ncbi:2-C-methyl-D-erythritol 4-phosphate cytidylyltransferase [Fibrobacter sp. UWR2]|uniref:IspD/TarI family cytidylyltransferase n=1 Tax=Fibrobacter sp. UWR2 TaxID=1964352 RepID=UPI0011835C06|nr:2-C-methyl-D-erythritol 4-phosphate cytidylyltransferase [Fibrobacter sp. UWR2]